MPMFQEQPEKPGYPERPEFESLAAAEMQKPLSRRLSEESIRTDLCEGPIPDSPPPKPATPEPNPQNVIVSDRAELIERLKRGESPTWIPNRHLESLFHQNKTRSPPTTPQKPTSTSPSLMPPADITPERQDVKSGDSRPGSRLQDGLNIERPRSALHSGDFTPKESSPSNEEGSKAPPPAQVSGFGSANAPWIATSPPREINPFASTREIREYRRQAFNSRVSSPSSSLSSELFYKPPTSPLVQSEINEDIGLALPLNDISIATGSPRHSRRHTLNCSQSSPYSNHTGQRQIPVRRDGMPAYQAHQPRRSLTGTPSLSLNTSSPQTPAFLRPRGPSLSSEVSPLQHASMVGSYEESILRGRMSTTPSKPLEFMAQIGVLGLGKCKPSLRCPSHVTLPFSAVFYSYASTSYGRSKSEDGPSPYVGQIDLENGLVNPDEGQRAKRKRQSRYSGRKAAEDGSFTQDNAGDASETETRTTERPKKRSRSPKAPPGGRYRIPEKGQLQIIIKNQNKTAVKLFLVPYDLAGMEIGTKTFIRQRSYSAGPIIENVETSSTDRPILRYLIHLHICCPSQGRYYLYRSIRVVFANRVPDGKERLRNEITYPEPRFTPYKPLRTMHTTPVSQTSGPGASLAAENAAKRRSLGFSFKPQQQQQPPQQQQPHVDGMDGISNLSSLSGTSIHHYSSLSSAPGLGAPVKSLLFALPTLSSEQPNTVDNIERDSGSFIPSPTAPSRISGDESMTGLELTGSAVRLDTYNKLNRGDVGYGGNAFAALPTNGRPGVSAEGLLSRSLRSLGMQLRPSGEQEADGGASLSSNPGEDTASV